MEQTNNHACEVLDEEKFSNWAHVTSEEMEAFAGFSFLTGLNPNC